MLLAGGGLKIARDGAEFSGLDAADAVEAVGMAASTLPLCTEAAPLLSLAYVKVIGPCFERCNNQLSNARAEIMV